ncbi:curlin [Vibrio splendidus]
MKLTQIGIIVGAIIGFNAANADPLPTSAPEPGPGVKEGTTDLGIAGKVAAIEPLAMDNTAVWQMGNGDQANVLINQNTSGVTDGHVALVNTHASYKSDVVIEQSGNLNEAHAKIRGVRNNALIDQDGLHNQARVKVQRGGRLNDLRVTQMGDENISVVKAKGGADRNEADVYINGNSNTTYTEFSNSSVDRNDVDIDLMNSNDNRIFTLQTGSYSNATVDLTNSNMNQLMVEQTSYDNAVVLGNGANGNVGLIYQN